jgi:hypothetical protein
LHRAERYQFRLFFSDGREFDGIESCWRNVFRPGIGDTFIDSGSERGPIRIIDVRDRHVIAIVCLFFDVRRHEGRGQFPDHESVSAGLLASKRNHEPRNNAENDLHDVRAKFAGRFYIPNAGVRSGAKRRKHRDSVLTEPSGYFLPV